MVDDTGMTQLAVTHYNKTMSYYPFIIIYGFGFNRFSDTEILFILLI